jgi:hypothetical protein
LRLQRVGALAHRVGLPEQGIGLAALLAHARLRQQLGHQHVPAGQRHQQQDQDGAARDRVALRPERAEAVGVGPRCRLDGGQHGRRGAERGGDRRLGQHVERREAEGKEHEPVGSHG